MLLMVSVQNMEEAKQALKGNADIIDVKNLQEALVGSAHPWLVKEVRDYVPQEIHASVTLGVVPNQVGTVAMAVYSAGLLNATSVKVGFMNTEYDMAVDILLASKQALSGTETKLIGSLFADNDLYDGLDPNKMVDLAKDGGCDGFLIDTLIKDGRNLFDFMPEEILTDIIYQGKSMGISTALSGHLRLDNLDELARINPDIVGVRGAVCSKGERDNSVYWEAVAKFRKELNLRESGEIAVRELNSSDNGVNGDGWVVIDGTDKSCASIILELSEQVVKDSSSFVEVVMPDVLNSYDVIVWAQKGGHKVISQRKENDGTVRILVQPR